MSLCDRCQHVLRYERANHQATYYCASTSSSVRVPGDIARCSDFSDRNAPSRFDMEKVAWTLNTDRSGKAIGFQPPKKEEER